MCNRIRTHLIATAIWYAIALFGLYFLWTGLYVQESQDSFNTLMAVSIIILLVPWSWWAQWPSRMMFGADVSYPNYWAKWRSGKGLFEVKLPSDELLYGTAQPIRKQNLPSDKIVLIAGLLLAVYLFNQSTIRNRNKN